MSAVEDRADVDEAEAETGPSIEDEAENLDAETGPIQMYLPGLRKRLTLDIGGDHVPEAATLRIMGGKLHIDGEYVIGTRLQVVYECLVTEVAGVASTKNDEIVGIEKQHKAKAYRVRVVAINGHPEDDADGS